LATQYAKIPVILRITPSNYPIGLMRYPKLPIAYPIPPIAYPIPPTAYLIEPVEPPIRKIINTKLPKG